jgi:hypothetical protein
VGEGGIDNIEKKPTALLEIKSEIPAGERRPGFLGVV